MKFDPTVSTGTIIQTILLVASVSIGYGKYTEDQTRQDGRIGQVEVLAEKDRLSTRDALHDLKLQIIELQRSNQQIKEGLASLRGEGSAYRGQPPQSYNPSGHPATPLYIP